ncbi:RDD family protein [Streptomyces sp. NPDC006739]|uniref:RDD family protein n=1 Tax=Streptomyces sp. NPDC006739 TaxID=3364763 RepID=UPI003693DCBB
MSAPTPAPGDDRPREGYYPDPSIPGYVRYWNGAAWVPGTSRPAPRDGESPAPPPGARPAAAAAPAVEETGPHFFDEDPAPSWGADRAQQSGFGGDPDRRVSWGGDPRVPADPPAEASAPSSDGTFVFRRPTPGDAPAGSRDEGTMTFRPVRGGSAGPAGSGGSGAGPASGGPGNAGIPAQGGGAGFGTQGPVGAPQASGPGFAAGKAAAARAAQSQSPAPAAQVQTPAPAAVAPSLPQQQPMATGAGGGQSSWAQQVHRLAGAGDEQPLAPWKPPVEDVFQAAARRQAAARPAGLGKRLLARLIDGLVLGAVTGAAAVPLGTRAADHVRQKIDAARLSGRTVTVWLLDGTTGTYLGIVLAVLLLAGVLYEALPTAKWGRTLGKKLCGLEVRDIEGHQPPAFGASLRRWLVYSVPGLLGIGIVGVAWCLFDRPWHQCWHDKAAHTFVAAG